MGFFLFFFYFIYRKRAQTRERRLTREYLGRLCRQSFFRRSFDIDDKDGDCVLVMKDNKRQTFQIMTPQGLEVGHADLDSDHSKVTIKQLPE